MHHNRTVRNKGIRDNAAFFSFMYFSISNISRMLMHIGIPRELPYIIYIFLFVKYVIESNKKIKAWDLVIWTLLCLGPLFGIIEYHAYIDSTSLYSIVLQYLPAYYFFRTCDIGSMTKGIKWSAYYSGIYILFYYIIFIRGTNGYDLSYGYWAAFPLCILFFFLIKGEIKTLFLIIPLFITMLTSGSRGALGVSVACWLYYLIIPKKLSFKYIVRTALLLIPVLVLYLNLDSILINISRVFGMSRNITKILNQGFFYSKTREQLYQICKQYIEQNPLGYGALATRKLLTGYPYPHSLYYELQLDYGKYLGCIATFVICICTIKLAVVSKKIKDYSCICGYICIVGVLALFVSSSLYYEYKVQAVFALLMNIKEHRMLIEEELQNGK